MEAFCILAAGRGERLQKVIKLHKCLASIDNKAVISHIIDKAPRNAEIIIAIGHQGQIVKEYCQAAHPDRPLTFVEVDNFDKPGSGPGYSLSCCKKYLQRPFYLFCSDCIVSEELPPLTSNWIGVFPVTNPIHWSTAQVYDSKVVNFKNKGKDGYDFAWIGVAGIKDYSTFWSKISHKDREFEVVSAFYDPLDYDELIAYPFTWHDTGTPENYYKSKEILGNSNLGMTKEINEITYKVGSRCVKVFGDSAVARGRIERAKHLRDMTPSLRFAGTHVYAYEWVKGRTLYEMAMLPITTLALVEQFLQWCEEELWVPDAEAQPGIKEQCLKFYKDKTYSRLRTYLTKKNLEKDQTQVIRGRICNPIETYLDQIDWEWLTDGLAVRFHGDLQFENVIFGEDGRFYLIDWRDCFGDTTTFGDLYYDLAKLNGGLMMCYHKIKQGCFEVIYEGNTQYTFEVPQAISDLREYYENWLLKRGFDFYKVRVLTALIYLNMSPLHMDGFDDLLFYHAKYLLSML